ncbi:Holliday junction ATP-dependent DNA helicase RuvA [Bifidobacterium sp. GSD1FS]|uniref:Holliday junction ATP-dependent DNA helicase RuvA n=1 Tax=Bifidobacterium canis TaxID=2610880 RepID=A0A7K1J6S7_9BIFI|nr:Holliday junction ATP-dependent DNA helicase RuvA [Bifidobacterium canis]
MSLGWHQSDAQEAVENVIAANEIETPLSTEQVPQVLKLALTSLDRGR